MATAAAAATGWAGYADWTFVESLAVDAAGDVLVAGTVPTDSDGAGDVDGSEMAVVRFAPDGTPDDAFGAGGLAAVTFAGRAYASTYAMAVDPASGRVAVGGSAGPAAYGLPDDDINGGASAVAVLAADGTLDPTWASGGWDDGSGEMVQVEGGNSAVNGVVTALAFDAGGRLLAAGVSDARWAGVTGPTFVLRYGTDGYLDPSFSPGVRWYNTDPSGPDHWGGAFRWGSPTEAFTPTTVAVDAAGRIDLVGHGGALDQGGDFAVMRLRADGQGLDTSYGQGGVADVGPADGYGNGSGSVAVTAAGDLLAVGGTTDGRGGVLLAFAPAPHPRQPVPADRLYAEQDANENVTSLTDAAGVTVERYIYGSYGQVTVENPDGTTRGDGSAAGSYYGMAYLYQDMRLDVVTNTYDGKERVYDVDLDRWLQQDPAGDVNGPNRYQFVRGNPVGYADPSGLAAAAGGSGLAPSGLSVTPTGQVTVGGSLGSIGLNVPAAPAGDTLVVSGLSAGGTCGDPTSFQLAGGAATATAPAATAVAAALEAGMTSGWVHYPDNALLGYQLADPGDGGVNVAMAIVAVVAGGGPEDPVTDGIAAELLSGDAGLGVNAAIEVDAAENVAVPQTLCHYTNEAGLNGILDDEALNPSLKALNPNDVRYGNGQYLSDIEPGTMTPAQLSRQFLNQPFQGAKFTHYVEVDVSGLNVVQGRPGVFVVPNETPLNLTGRIVNSGPVTGR